LVETQQIQQNKLDFQKNQDFLFFLESLQDDSHKIARKSFLMEHFKKMSLENKIQIAVARIEEFIKKCKQANKTPIISFSGGKDSCVLRHLVQKVDPTIKCETAAELFHPEIAKFLRTIPDTTLYKSALSFNEIIKTYGYPILSKEVAQKINNVRTSKTFGNWTLACFGLKNSRPIPKKFLHFIDEKFVKYLISSKCCNLIKGTVKNSKNPKFLGTTIAESQLRKTS
jgi:hypothetical protein